MSGAFESVEAARRLLERGMVLLGGEGRGDVAEELERLTGDLGELPDPGELRGSVAEEDLERFDDELEEVMRLNAVLVSALSRDREVLGERILRVRGVRRVMGRSRGGESSGGRCDATG